MQRRGVAGNNVAITGRCGKSFFVCSEGVLQ